MNIEELFSGVGLVIDDKVNVTNGEDRITKIVDLLENKNIPLIKRNSIPNQEILEHCKNLNFILLDWELYSLTSEDGMPLPNSQVIEKENENCIVDFLKKILDKCFLPIFIFSNKAEESIINILKESVLPKFFLVDQTKENAHGNYYWSRCCRKQAERCGQRLSRWRKL